MILAISINSTVSAENKNTDVWAYSSMVTGEWGRVLVNDYVMIDSIQGNNDIFTVNVKSVGDVSKNQIAIEKYEFRRKDDLWCAYPVTKNYVPVSTHVNERIIAIFDICKQYSSFITLSESDIKAREAKKYFDRGTSYYFDDKDYNNAIDCFTRAINLYPKYEDAYVRRARAYSAKGDYDNAIADYRYVLKIGKDDYGIAKRELEDVINAKKKRGY